VKASLALSGGGSLGAYTAGVLDALLEREAIEVDGVTGASAGAIDAALLGVGFTRGGPEEARRILKAFWSDVGLVSRAHRRPWWRGAVEALRSIRGRGSIRALHALAIRSVADFAMDPSTMEPLRGLLNRYVEPSALGKACPLRVFINATRTRDFEPQVFAGEEIDTDAILASACVPLLFDPVWIKGEPYWDGGFIGNPAIYPVIYECEASDVVLVRTTAIESEPPRTAGELLNRVIEASCLSALKRELRAIEFVSELVRGGGAPLRDGLREIRVHTLETHPELEAESRGGNFNTDPAYLARLFAMGREAGASWKPGVAVR